MRLLVIEDEPRIAEILREALEHAEFTVDAVANCGDARAAVDVTAYDAVVLDLGLPDGDGIVLLRELRRAGNQVPILVLTARDAVEDRVGGLDAGADDYLVKPFAMAEVIARVKALLRRPGGALGVMLTVGNLSFDTIGRDVRIANRVVLLPRRETAILEHLMRRVGRVVPKSVLEEKLYGFDDELESNAIPVHVHHLRRKLLDAGASAEISHGPRGRLPAQRNEGVMRLRAPSLQLRLAFRLALVYLTATAVAAGILVYRALDTAGSLNERELAARADDIAASVSMTNASLPRIDLPPSIAKA
jgi:DNA-binding response OmpR family regulator